MQSSLVIREATTSDKAVIAELVTALGYPAEVDDIPVRLEQLDQHPGAVVLLAEVDGAVLGALTMHVFPSLHATGRIAWITMLVVAPVARGKGVGAALVGAAEKLAHERGAIRISVASGIHRADAHAFYQRLGYPQSGIRFTRTLGDAET